MNKAEFYKSLIVISITISTVNIVTNTKRLRYNFQIFF